jgi:hypothetical protein
MNSNKIIILIGAMLFVFVLIKVIADQFCAGGPNNAVSTTVSDAISSAASNPAPSRPDPLSWEPLGRQILVFFSKACNR